VTGAALLDVQGIGFDHPEQTVWRNGLGVIGFRTATHGDSDCLELTLSALEPARIEVRADIHGYTKVGDPLSPPPHVHAPFVHLAATGEEMIAAGEIARDLPGVELRIALERVTDAPLPRDVSGEIRLSELGLEPGGEHPLFLIARQRDQTRIWTSPLFLTPKA
jgi:hypothetical protein